MKRRLTVIFLTTIFSITFFALFQKKIDEKFLISGDSKLPQYSDPAKLIKVKLDTEFAIILDANRTTGYGWQISGDLHKQMLKVIEIKHRQNKSQLVGSGGKDIWTFKALQEGEVALVFEYVRPWEKGVPPIKKQIFNVVING